MQEMLGEKHQTTSESTASTADISKFSYPKNVPKKPKNLSNFATFF